jgi:hypothetical protein
MVERPTLAVTGLIEQTGSFWPLKFSSQARSVKEVDLSSEVGTVNDSIFGEVYQDNSDSAFSEDTS